MSTGPDIKHVAHKLIDRMSDERVKALVDLLDEEFFSDEEISELTALRASKHWVNWRDVRRDVRSNSGANYCD